MITKYRNKISGPLLERIDMHVEVPAVKYSEMAGGARGEASEKYPRTCRIGAQYLTRKIEP